jgi:hypothetical protein
MDAVLLAGLLEELLGMTFVLMVYAVTPKAGVLRLGVAEAAFRLAPLEKVRPVVLSKARGFFELHAFF